MIHSRIAKRLLCLICLILLAVGRPFAQEGPFPTAGADTLTPSRSHFFDWINSQYEGTTEKQTLINLDFFKWLHDEFGMTLDVYSLDVGNIDDGPYTAGVGRLIPYHYGSLESREYREQFPNGFAAISKKAASFGCRLGLWMGPDGFGSTPEDEQKRKELMIRLCRDYNFYLFKLDGVAGPFRKEKAGVLIETLRKCREYTPDLIVSSHRIDFGEAESYITHHLWEGEETYVDVFINNRSTAPHHRAGSLERKLTPGLFRMYEDHGVCFSSCLDYWEDELVLQAFNRSLILAPQIYGNPWFLRDDEYPRLARIFNLQEKYGDLLVRGFQLPEKQYGPYAMSRGDGETRLVTLRNLSWEPKEYMLSLDGHVGLSKAAGIRVKMYHPVEEELGEFAWGSTVRVTVDPYRSCLVKLSSLEVNEISIRGCKYEIIRDVPGKPLLAKLLGMPGTKARISVDAGAHSYSGGRIGEKEYTLSRLESGVTVVFPGEKPGAGHHRLLGRPSMLGNVPPDAEALFEATCFAADNNALEVRCIERSGPTRIPQVQGARDEFFSKPMFINRGIWDKNLFDGDLNTHFIARLEDRMLRLDLGKALSLEYFVIRIRDRQEYDMNPDMNSFNEKAFAEVSDDLLKWDSVQLDYTGKGTIARIRLDPDREIRYLRITGPPRRIAEIEAWSEGRMADRKDWRASNLFGNYAADPAVRAWEYEFRPDEIPANSYLAVALNGKHGNEGAYAALRIDGKYIGSPDRAVSYPSNTWEYFNVESETDYTYYFPVDASLKGKKVEVVILGLESGVAEFVPEVWITAYPVPYEEIMLELK
jgi:hypothetical protein